MQFAMYEISNGSAAGLTVSRNLLTCEKDVDMVDIKRGIENDSQMGESKRSKIEADIIAPSAIPAFIDGAINAELPSIPLTGTAPVSRFDNDQLTRPAYHDQPTPFSRLGLKPTLPELPPSLELVTGVKTDLRSRKGFVGQEEVGIIGYAGPSAFKGVKGVIKQR